MIDSANLMLQTTSAVRAGRLVMFTEREEAPAVLGLTVQLDAFVGVYWLDGRTTIRRFPEWPPFVLDVGKPILRYDPRGIVLPEALRSGGLYLTDETVCVFLPDRFRSQGGKLLGFDGSYKDATTATMFEVPMIEVGVIEAGEFLRLVTCVAPPKADPSV